VLIPSAGENYISNFIRNMDYFRIGLSRLEDAAVNGKPTVDPSIILGGDKTHTREFALAMHNNAAHHGKDLACYLDTSNCKTLLDLGSGPGTYAFHLGLKNPELEIYLLDGPEILEVAREIRHKWAIKNKVYYLAQDALKEDVPGTYDMILVSNTLHMIGEKGSKELIKRLFKSINKGGSLVIQAQFLKDNKMGDKWPIFMDLIQLCITPEGRNHSVGETKSWLEDAGFVNIAHKRMSVLNTNSFIRAYRQ
jgi:SAM-dependent methyltransferase